MSVDTDPIRTHFVVLCNTLNVENILPYLRAERMVTPDEYEELSEKSTRVKQKRERLLLMMPKKGSDYFKNFGNCLVWSGQQDLAKHIGVVISAVPPCPHTESVPGTVTPQDPFQAMNKLMTPGGSLPPGMSTSSTQPALPRGTYFDDYAVLESEAGQWAPHILGTEHHPSAPLPYPTPATATTHHTHPYQPQPALPPHSGNPVYTQPYQPSEQQSGPRPPSSGGGGGDGGPPPNTTPPKVFFLYHKDPSLAGITPIELFDQIKDTADILGSVGGFDLSADFYHDGDVGNWGAWTDEKIRQSRYVVLLCSPRLVRGLSSPETEEYKQLEMERGSFFTSSVVNLINAFPQKFIPVFFPGMDTQLVPIALTTAAKYTLDVDSFGRQLPSEMGSYAYKQEISAALAMLKFNNWERLVRHLRGASHDVPPPASDIPLQPAGTYYPAQPPPQHGSRRFNQQELLRVSQRVSSDWQALGIRLGVHSSQLDSIDHKNSDPIRATMEMLRYWMGLRGQYATRSALKAALLGLNYGALAQELFEHD